MHVRMVEPIVGAQLRPSPGQSTYHRALINLSDANQVRLGTDSTVFEDEGGIYIRAYLNDPAPENYSIPIAMTPPLPNDYVAIDSIQILAGETRGEAYIELIDDEVSEYTEYVRVRVGSDLPHGVIGTRYDRFFRIEDDDAPRIGFAARSSEAYEDEGPYQIQLTTGGYVFDQDIQIPVSARATNSSAQYNGPEPDLRGPS